MPTPPESAAIIRSTQSALADLAALSADQLVAWWDALDSLNQADLLDFLNVALPASTGVANTAASLQAAATSSLADMAPVGIDTQLITDAIETKLRQPFTATWRQLSLGTPFEEAVTVGRSALEAVGRDVSYGSARQAVQLIDVPSLGEVWQPSDRQQKPTKWQVRNWQRPAWKSWRRVLTPASCSWCQFFATLSYYSAESATFGHPRCDCFVVQETPDTGPVIAQLNDEVLEAAGFDEGAVTKELEAYRRRKKARPVA